MSTIVVTESYINLRQNNGLANLVPIHRAFILEKHKNLSIQSDVLCINL